VSRNLFPHRPACRKEGKSSHFGNRSGNTCSPSGRIAVYPYPGEDCGVRIAWLVLEASVHKGAPSVHNNSDNVKSLIDFGEPNKKGTDDPGDPSNPRLLSYIFTRVGGANLDRSVKTDVMVRRFSGNSW